ncbi:HD-GYP domain-containing protein [Colwellia sp. 75C3]|uniref:HD-GYP domain-containing protein n=1 Tax=Colwellia sp. 75C3 TaxID=888425 RepID=UPI0018E34418|nr:HD-GYP domain-containing protein [Colwellia sp. 75C3]
MIKTSVYNLAIGMHVSKLDRDWLSTSFFRHSFLINNETQLKRLRAECLFVFIDNDKCKTKLLSPIQPTPTESIQSAGIKVKQTKKLLIKFFSQLKQGVKVDTKLLISSINTLSRDVFNDTTTYLYLVKLKEKDDSLSEKSMNVFIFYLAFAKHIGVKKTVLLEIGTAAILHDIGMISAPEELFKSAFLNKDERKFITNHTNVGIEILAHEKIFSNLTIKIIKSHHENVDGSGYPDGLSGRDISVYARMLNITCMYEALTRDRIYRKAISPIEAVNTLVRNINTKLDARLTLKFVEMLGLYPIGSTVYLNNGHLVQIISFNDKAGFCVIPYETATTKSLKAILVQAEDIDKIAGINSCFTEVS